MTMLASVEKKLGRWTPQTVSSDLRWGGLESSRREWWTQWSPVLSRTAAYLVSILVCAPFLYHLAHGSNAYLGLLEDDYFYYAIIADKFVSLGKLTYDGTTLTNGFHPLWFGILTLLRAVFGGLGSAFYVALTVVFLASMLITYELGRIFARELGASPVAAAAIPAVYSVGTAKLLSSGMECAIAVPLFLWFLIEVARQTHVTPKRAAKLGFMASLAILGRLDLAIAVGLLIVSFIMLVRPPMRTLARLSIAFAAGGILVPLYASLNIIYFGSPFPTSAIAKQLQSGWGFNVTYAQRVALGTVYGPTMAIVLPLGLIALLVAVRRNRWQRPAARLAGGLPLVFAFAFFGLNALSGWTFFGWYAYPMAAATTAALVFIVEGWGPRMRDGGVGAIAATVLVALAPALAIRYYVEHGPRWSVADNSLLAMSVDLAGRLKDREGLFGMGAVAGVATYVLDKPVLQLEGIVADRQLVEHVRAQDPLEDVLREYRVDYLIVSLSSVRAQMHDGCYIITQPNAEWAGERSAKMRGEICGEPILHFTTERGPNSWSRFSQVETLVWDLRSATWRELSVDNSRP